MADQATQTNFYETDKAVSEYLLFHYGDRDDLLYKGIGPQEALNFAQRCGRLHQNFDIDRLRALDLGCAVGGASYAMSESFAEVIGIDFSRALVEAATLLGQEKEMEISVSLEGDLQRKAAIALPQNSRPDRTRFHQGDAMALDRRLGTFDFILMANLIDRLPDPAKCLESIPDYLNTNGLLAITSPYTWLIEYTPKDKWLGGYTENGNPLRTSDRLGQLLSPRFRFAGERNLPFLIREHERKNQYSIAHATLWQKL